MNLNIACNIMNKKKKKCASVACPSLICVRNDNTSEITDPHSRYRASQTCFVLFYA